MTDRIRPLLDAQFAAEAPFTRFPDLMPDRIDLSAPVIAPDGPPEVARFDDFAARSRNLARQFAGQPGLFLAHAQSITLLRRRAPPAGTAALFLGFWEDHGARLAAELDPRWCISAATTFASHGATGAQRQAGEGLATLFGMLKLSETERLYSGLAPDTPFRPGRSRAALPMQMAPYAIHGGDLDRALITRIWTAAMADDTIAPLCRRLLGDLLEEPAGLFARLARMRQRRSTR